MMDLVRTWRPQGLVVLLPVGSLEYHGGYLPMGTDGLLAEAYAREAVKGLEEVDLAPTVYFTTSHEHGSFPHFSVSYLTAVQYLTEVVLALSSRYSSVIVVNGHGGNQGVLEVVSREVNFVRKRRVRVFHAFGKRRDYHAGSDEGSEVAFLLPELVGRPPKPGFKEGAFEYLGTDEVSGTGVVEDSEVLTISRDRGGELFRSKVEELRKIVQEELTYAKALRDNLLH